jgi:hypothetical protein
MIRPLARLGFVLALTAAAAADTTRTFDAERAGGPPDGFTFAAGRNAPPGSWLVRKDGANGFLEHSADRRQDDAPAMAVLAGPPVRDVRLTVRLRLVDGDREGGLVWRYQNPDNYYVARLDLEDHEVALHRFVRGHRVRLAEQNDLELDPEAWHTLRVAHGGDEIRVYLGGVRVLRVRDRTIQEAGAVGLWTDVTSTTWFDDLRVETGVPGAPPR